MAGIAGEAGCGKAAVGQISAEEAARLVIFELLGLAPSERAVIVRDDASPEPMVAALWQALRAAGIEAAILHQPARPAERKNLLNPAIAAALTETEAMLAITGSGGAPIYAGEVKALLDARRLRFVSMVMRSMDNLTAGGATADYRALLAEGRALRRHWQAGGRMRITSPAGTDLSAPVATDRVVVECGYATEPGSSAAFSDGEVSGRPEEGAAEGVLVVDGPGAVIGMPDAPVAVRVGGGRAVAVESAGRAADRLQRILEEVDGADCIAEFGIGLNPACRRNGDFEEEKKARGQVHVALGDNLFYGGTTRSEVHMDMVVRDPTVTLDGRALVEGGRLILDAP